MCLVIQVQAKINLKVGENMVGNRKDYIIDDASQKSAFSKVFSIKINGEYLHLSTTQKLAFGVKANEDDTAYEIYKEITYQNVTDDGNGYILQLSASDMDIAKGKHFYGLALIDTDNSPKQFIPNSWFLVDTPIIMGAV